MKRAIITGAGGMLGAALTRELLQNDVKVLALLRPGSSSLPAHPLLTQHFCDLSQLAAFTIPNTLSYDVFYHLAWAGTYGAAREDVHLQESNIRYTLNALSLAKRLQCKRFVGAGSQAEYGKIPFGTNLSPNTPAAPITGYGIAKLAAGLLGKLYAQQAGLSFQWIRVLSVYGPMEKHHCLTTSTILRLLRGQPVHFTKGEQIWDFLHCDDAARALRLVGEHGVDGQTYVLGSAQPIRLSHALSVLCHAVNPAAEVPLGSLPYPKDQCMYLCADISILNAHTGFTPQIPYTQGIQHTIEWIKEQEWKNW